MLYNDSHCFRCNCCGTLPDGKMDSRLVDILNWIGVNEEDVNCGYRCPKHNKEVGGVPNSQHLYGIAADIDASRWGVDELADLAEQRNADGIGKYYGSNFVHIDTRGEKARWEE